MILSPKARRDKSVQRASANLESSKWRWSDSRGEPSAKDSKDVTSLCSVTKFVSEPAERVRIEKCSEDR